MGGINLSKLVALMNGIKNPKEGLNMAVNMLMKKNPQMGNLVQMAINSGKNPKDFITESARNGQININQLKQLKQLYGMASTMNLSHKVPDSVWQEAENAIKLGSQITNNSPTQMSGF